MDFFLLRKNQAKSAISLPCQEVRDPERIMHKALKSIKCRWNHRVIPGDTTPPKSLRLTRGTGSENRHRRELELGPNLER